jgi:hypothetical protein
MLTDSSVSLGRVWPYGLNPHARAAEGAEADWEHRGLHALESDIQPSSSSARKAFESCSSCVP